MLLTSSDGKCAKRLSVITERVTETHLFAKNNSDAPFHLPVQKHATSRSNVTTNS